MSLKNMTREIHEEAENTKWSQLLVSGNILDEQYGQYLYNLLHIYESIENTLSTHGFWAQHPALSEIKRVIPITYDRGMFKSDVGIGFEKTTVQYGEYLRQLDVKALLAHLYVRHFGDMYGGQIIAKKVPLPTQYYAWQDMAANDTEADSDGRESYWLNPTFTDPRSWTNIYHFENKAEMKKYLRPMLDVTMADEAIYAFRNAINLFKDLENRFGL